MCTFSINRILFIILLFSFFSHRVQAGEPDLSVQTGHSFKITQLQFSDDGRILGSLSEDNSILLWDTKTGRQITRFTSKEAILSFAFHSESKNISLVTKPGKIITIDYESDSVINEKHAGDSLIKIIPVKNEFLVIDRNQVIQYSAAFNTPLKSFQTESDEEIRQAYLSDDGSTLFLILRETKGLFKFMRIKYVRVSDLSPVKLAPVYYTKSEIDPNASMAFSNDKKFFISQYQYTDQFSFDGEKLKRETKYAVSEKFHNMITSLSAFNGKLFTGLHNGDIHVYDYNEKKYRDVLKGHKTDVTAMTSFPGNNWLVSGDANGLILLWDAHSNTLVHALIGTNEQITCFSMKEDESAMIIGYLNGDLKYWDRITQETKKINLQKVQAKAAIGFNYVITSIDPYSSDSIVNFDCSYGFSLRKNMFDHVVYYKGKWNINSNRLELVEIGTEFQERAIVTSPADFYKIMYEGAGSNPHLKDTSGNWVVSAIGNTLFTKGNSGVRYIYTTHQGEISAVKIIGETVYTAGWDGTIKWYDPTSGKEKLTMGINGRSGFFYFLPNGFYYASKKALRYLSFRIGDHVFPFDQFDMVYNRPDLILDSLQFIDQDIVSHFKLAYEKRKSRSKQKHIDENSLAELPEITVQTSSLVVKDGKLTLTVSAKDPKVLITDIFIYVNGVPEKRTVFTPAEKVDLVITLNLGYEMNNILVYAQNELGWTSLKQELNVLNKQRLRKANRYLITIGSGAFAQPGYDLNFAAKDARDVNSFLKSGNSFKNIYTLHFENKTVTKEILNEISRFISNAGEKDQIVLFYAGHGVLDNQFNYYLSAYEMDFNNPAGKGILYTDLEKILNDSKVREKLLLIDACHSGEIDKEAIREINTENSNVKGKIKFRSAGISFEMSAGALELSKMVFADTENSAGISVISSSGGGELSIEGEEWNNGLFTYAVLNGLKKEKADENNDGVILISEIQNYVSKTVSGLSDGKQKPNARSENILNDFIIKK